MNYLNHSGECYNTINDFVFAGLHLVPGKREDTGVYGING